MTLDTRFNLCSMALLVALLALLAPTLALAQSPAFDPTSQTPYGGPPSPTPMLPVDGSHVTQPVSAVALPLPPNAAQENGGNLAAINAKLPTLASGRVPVDGSGVTQPISATALPLPSNAATAANQITGNASLAAIQTAVTGATPSGANTIGAVTQSGTWTFGLSGPIPAGTNIIGKVGLQVAGADVATANPLTVASPYPDATVASGSPYSATAAGVLFDLDTTGYASLSVQITSIGSGNTVVFEGSNDGGATYITHLGDSTGSALGLSSTTTANGITLPCTMRRIRARVSTYGSGTVTAYAVLRSTPETIRAVSATILSGSITPVKATTGGLGTFAFRTTSAASANAANIKPSAGQIYGYHFANTSTGWRFVHLYNLATPPTMGTSSDTIVIPIPAGGAVSMNFADIGVQGFGTGLAIAVTTSPAANDNTVAGIGVGDVTGALYYG